MVVALFFSAITSKAQQALSVNLFSQNGWIQDTVGGGTNALDSNQCPGLKYGFKLPCVVSSTYNINKNNLWFSVKNSQSRVVRFGGTTADQNKPELWQYLKFVDSVRASGMEPILQISVNLGSDGTYHEVFQKILHLFQMPVKRNLQAFILAIQV